MYTFKEQQQQQKPSGCRNVHGPKFLLQTFSKLLTKLTHIAASGYIQIKKKYKYIRVAVAPSALALCRHSQ